ncbi:Paired domain-containing protein [Caenorhabditis elegans]|uniref:Paired domain-containing protein n=1 Tax=Caenorhabditis elegans TaxID=6239 RepID=Q21972_CAEEL|nr:Paired domain-containing protein [Caenorhabditis elegans]CAA97441.2 Paired domain-containing protein [Caenorhabditis elegans]|eukprot:NP_502006.2 N-terminal PAX (PAI domain only) protein [Caenorhabditis elegans]
MLDVHCCDHEQCGSSVIDLSTPHTLQRDFNNWLNGIEVPNSYESQQSDSSSSVDESGSKTSSPTSMQQNPSQDGRKNRKKGTNLYGRPYCPGRPLSMEERTRIIQLHNNGMKVNAISKSLCISHGCVSKIISRFRATGVLLPACSPEQRKSRKRKSSMEGSAMEQSFIPVFVSMQDANGNEYLNEYYSIPVGNNDGSGYDYPVSI